MRILAARLRRATVLACVPLAFTLGCTDNSTNPSTADISGTYSLQSIGGIPLPYSFQSGTTTVTLTNDVLIVGSDGTWSETIAFTQVDNGQTTTGTLDDGGTWTRSGVSVNFFSQPAAATAYTGTYSNNTLTLDDGSGAPQVFRR
jgi:hypothetical protein